MEIVESSLKVSDRENASIEGRDCEEKRREGREREARNDEFYEEDESESSPRTTTGKKKQQRATQPIDLCLALRSLTLLS